MINVTHTVVLYLNASALIHLLLSYFNYLVTYHL